MCLLVCLKWRKGSLCSASPIIGLEPLFVLGQLWGHVDLWNWVRNFLWYSGILSLLGSLAG